jgi:hypothetical protein
MAKYPKWFIAFKEPISQKLSICVDIVARFFKRFHLLLLCIYKASKNWEKNIMLGMKFLGRIFGFPIIIQRYFGMICLWMNE